MTVNTATVSATSSNNAWSPILDDALRAQVLKSVQEIADSLPQFIPAHASLAGGLAGLAVFQAYLAQTRNDDDAAQTAGRLLVSALEQTATTPMPPSLYGGFTGVAWAVEHLSAQLLDTDDDDPNEAVDALLLEYLKRTPWRGDYDLIIGLVGLGVYALERLPRPAAVKCLELIVERLAETAERNAQGSTWLSPPYLLPEWQRELCPQGYYNLGLAHGVPGVIALAGTGLRGGRGARAGRAAARRRGRVAAGARVAARRAIAVYELDRAGQRAESDPRGLVLR